jgi:hypothetical protein
MKFLTCKEATKLASQRMDRRLGFAERAGLRIHLAICDGCARVTKQMAFLRTAVRQLGTRE